MTWKEIECVRANVCANHVLSVYSVIMQELLVNFLL